MMKKSPTLLRIRRGSRKSRGHSRQGSAGVEVGSEEGQGKHRRASSWSPAQLADEDEGGRRHLGTSSPPSPHSSSSTSALPSSSNPSAVRTDVYTLPGLRRDEGNEEEKKEEVEEEKEEEEDEGEEAEGELIR